MHSCRNTAGGAYNYISLTLGELAAWLVVTTLVLVSNQALLNTWLLCHSGCTDMPELLLCD